MRANTAGCIMSKNMTINIEQLKNELEQELKKVEDELSTLGRRNPSNPADWEALPSVSEAQPGDENETADNIESYEENTAILKQLETRYNEIKKALRRMEEGKYGICEVGGEQIEKDRLNANPAATTCIAHKSSY